MAFSVLLTVGNSMDGSMAQASTSTQTDKRLFWHLGLTAYACPEKPDGHTFLRVYVTCSRLSEEKKKAHMEKIPPMKPSAAGLVGSPGTLDAGTVLWVGVQVENANDYRPKAKSANKAASNGSKQARKSVDDVINDGTVELLNHRVRTLRVVSSLKNYMMLQFHVLVDPDERGVCRAVSTDSDVVWFAHQYRTDDESNINKRRTQWSSKIRQLLQDMDRQL